VADYKITRALVTGGAGFVGGHVVAQLCEMGVKVRVLDLQTADLRNLKTLDIDFLAGDICETDSVKAALEGCDTLFHLAANPNLWAPDPETFRRTNTQGTEVTLAAAHELGTPRVVYTSTESILTLAKHQGRITEEVEPQLTDMLGPYTRSKFLAEECARNFAAKGLPVTIVNPTMPVGPGDVGLSPPGRLILDLAKGKMPAYMHCDLNVVDVRDVARGHILAAQKGRVGERYILGGENLTLAEWLPRAAAAAAVKPPSFAIPRLLAWPIAIGAELIAKISKRRPPVTMAGLKLAQRMAPFDSTRAREELGYSPGPVDRAVEDAISWFRQEGYL
jgi:dihydroflavonol-4-reductase